MTTAPEARRSARSVEGGRALLRRPVRLLGVAAVLLLLYGWSFMYARFDVVNVSSETVTVTLYHTRNNRFVAQHELATGGTMRARALHVRSDGAFEVLVRSPTRRDCYYFLNFHRRRVEVVDSGVHVSGYDDRTLKRMQDWATTCRDLPEAT